MYILRTYMYTPYVCTYIHVCVHTEYSRTPNSIREFLLQFGWSTLSPHRISGLVFSVVNVPASRIAYFYTNDRQVEILRQQRSLEIGRKKQRFDINLRAR